jgi:hypothetical protein
VVRQDRAHRLERVAGELVAIDGHLTRRSPSLSAPIAVHTALSDHACSGQILRNLASIQQLRSVLSGPLRRRCRAVNPSPFVKMPLPASVFCNENRRTTGLAHVARADSSAVRSARIPAGWPADRLYPPSRAVSAPHLS